MKGGVGKIPGQYRDKTTAASTGKILEFRGLGMILLAGPNKNRLKSREILGLESRRQTENRQITHFIAASAGRLLRIGASFQVFYTFEDLARRLMIRLQAQHLGNMMPGPVELSLGRQKGAQSQMGIQIARV